MGVVGGVRAPAVLGEYTYIMMGKSLELLGLAGFNVFLGMVLTVSFLNGNSDSSPSRLTETSVQAFVTEMDRVNLGTDPAMDSYSVTTWMMDHLDENSKFIINTNIAPANGEPREENVELGRMEYISHVLLEMKTMRDRESNVHIEYVKIDETGQTASVMYTNMEKGNIPYQNEGEEYMMPVSGTSYCEQQLALKDKVIRVLGTTCTSNVSLAQTY
jgi:hypothetical protein